MKILIAGDFCPIGRNEKLIQEGRYAALFNGFESVINKVDYAIVNLECPITTATTALSKTGPNIKTEQLQALEALQYVGFDLLTLANNHIQDYGAQGVMDTLQNAKAYGFETIGAAQNLAEAKKPVIKDINTVKLGIINIAENEFCAATDEIPGAYTFDFVDNFKLIKETKAKVDKLILIYHGGREHYQLPTPEQRKRLRFFIESGVDAIVAHHTHCVSGYEYYQNKPIVYSLGNFIFDYKKKYQKGLWTEGMSVILKLENDHFKLDVIPHFQGREMDSTLKLMNEKERDIFLNKLENLSQIIQNDDLFIENWHDYLNSQTSFYLPSLYIKNFYFRALFLKKILPASLLRFKHNKLLLNLLRCESHYEISRDILTREYERKNL